MLLSNLNLLATAPSGVARLRELILTLAVQGKLVPQDPSDEPASELLKKIRAEKDRLIAKGKIKRDKPLAEIAEDEQPFELPTGWEWVHLATLAEQITKGTTPTTFGHSYTSEGINFVKIENLDRGRLNLAQMTDFISRETHEIMSRSQLSAGDVLFSIAGTIGKTAVVLDADLPANTNQALAIIKGAAKHVNQRFLLLALDSFVSNKVKDKARGGAMNNISLGDLSELFMTIPPLAEQSRIVTRVEELMRLCDALEAKGQLEATQHAQLVSTLLATLTDSETPAQLADNWHRIATHFDLLLDRPEAVDALEQTILQLAVRGLLVPQDPQDEPASALLKKIRAEKDKLIAEGKIKRDKPLPPIAEDEQPFALPMGWAWQHVSDVVEMLNGYAFKSEWFKQTGVRLLRNLNVSHGYVDWSQPAAIDAKAATEYQQFALQVGDIVLSLDRPIISTGLKYAVIRETDLPCLLLQRVARLAPDAKLVSADFLALWLQSDLFVGTIDPGRSNGVPHISTKQVGGLAFALPPLAEQSRIVTRVAQLRRLCADLRERLTASQSTQAHLAEALVREVA
jgi:type I restriction enzyme S subunit